MMVRKLMSIAGIAASILVAGATSAMAGPVCAYASVTASGTPVASAGDCYIEETSLSTGTTDDRFSYAGVTVFYRVTA